MTRPRRPPRRRPNLIRAGLIAAALAIAFGVGLGLGESLHDNPKDGGTQTLVRTLKPLPLPPARVTVTVRKPRS
jgi:hypothetical protein